MLWFLRNVARNSPARISNVEITSLEFCAFLDTYEKLGYPNYVRLLVDEAPKANSCVRSSPHDTVHNPRDASNTTPTPHNAKSQKRGQPAVNRSPPFRVAQELTQDARQEVPGCLLARIIDHLLRRSLLDNLAVAQEHDAVGRLAGEADLVRRHEDG